MEILCCTSSENRLENSNNLQNASNDVKIKVVTDSNMLNASLIELKHINIPKSQRTIEKAWNRLYYMNGFQLSHMATYFQIEDMQHRYVAVIPPQVNFCNKQENNIFYFAQDHGFSVEHSRLLGVNCDPDNIIVLSKNSLEIKQFVIDVPTIEEICIITFPFVSTQELAAFINRQINDEYKCLNANCDNDVFLFAWNSCQSKFCLSLTSFGTNVVSNCCLVSNYKTCCKLGFLEGQLRLIPNNILFGSFDMDDQISYIELPCINYDCNMSLTKAIEFEFNRLWITENQQIIVINTINYQLTKGMYSDILILTEALDDLLSGTKIVVKYYNNQIIFKSDTIFELNFDISDKVLIRKLGFQPILYAGQTMYKSSEIWFHYGLPSIHCEAFVDENEQANFYFSRQCSSFIATQISENDNNEKNFFVQTYKNTGVSPNDFLQMFIDVDNFVYCQVQSILSSQEFLIQVLQPFTFQKHKSYTFKFVTHPQVSFLFNLSNSIKPILLGFEQKDCLYFSHHIKSPLQMQLNYFNFILIELVDPIGQGSIQYISKGQRKNQIWAKVYGTVDKEKSWNLTDQHCLSYPFRFSPSKRISFIHIRLLNPDYSLYELHNQNFDLDFLIRCQ